MASFWKNRLKVASLFTFVVVATFSLFYLCLLPGIYGGDSGDLVSAGYTLGIPHPPGYPLYTLLGYLFSKLSFGPTVAWRFSLFSAIASSLTCGLFFLFCFLVSKKVLPSILASFILGFSSSFWLYSIVQEVFALNNLIALSLVFLGWKLYQAVKAPRWRNKQKASSPKLLYAFSFLWGLSLTHHHTILFLLPGFLYLFYPFLRKNWSKIISSKRFLITKVSHFFTTNLLLFERNEVKSRIFTDRASRLSACALRSKNKICKTLVIALFFFFLGFSFYLYAPIASSSSPVLNWNNPSTLKGFLKLISRADYGTFLSSRNEIQGLGPRFLNIKAYFSFLKDNFSLLGLILAISGFISLLFKDKKLAVFLLILFVFSGPFFLFYAGFPVTGYFVIFVLERFMLVSNLFFVLFILFGIIFFGEIFVYFLTLYKKWTLEKNLMKNFSYLVVLPLILVQLKSNLLTLNFSKEYLGSKFAEDLLASAEKDSIILLFGDTALFSSYYAHFVEKIRPDLKIISAGRLNEEYIIASIKKYYPEISLPAKIDKVEDFIKANKMKLPIYSQIGFELGSGVWIPQGLLFKYYPKNETKKNEQFLAENKAILEKFPKEETLKSAAKKDLIFKDISDNYAFAFFNVGAYLFDKEDYFTAIDFLEKAVNIYPEEPEFQRLLGLSFSNSGKCQAAEKTFLEYEKLSKDKVASSFLLGKNYQECFGDEEKAKEFLAIFEEEKRKSETALNSL